LQIHQYSFALLFSAETLIYAAPSIVSSCVQDDVAYAFNLARELDKNKDGRITAKEFQVFWTKEGKPVPKNLVPFMTDVFGSTNVAVADFMAGILRILKESEPDAEELEQKQSSASTFTRLDKDGSGDLTLAELQVFFAAVMRNNDKDNSDTLDEAEFKNMVPEEA
jgi:Ca2+-binding EF-hand superfamily protein